MGTSYETSPYNESDIGGRTKLPAFYYAVEVCAGSSESLKVFRRYSEFEWLYHKLKSSPTELESLKMFPTLPPKTSFCQVQTDDFRYDRQIELKEFLDDVLSRPGYASHPAMKSFLLLSHIYGDDETLTENVDLEALAKLKEQYDKQDEEQAVTEPVVETEEEVVTEEAQEEPVVETAVVADVPTETTENVEVEEPVVEEVVAATTEVEEKVDEEETPIAEEATQETEAPTPEEDATPPEEEAEETKSEVQTSLPAEDEENKIEEKPAEEVVEEKVSPPDEEEEEITIVEKVEEKKAEETTTGVAEKIEETTEV